MTVFNLLVPLFLLVVTKPATKVLFFARVLVIVSLVVNGVELYNELFPEL